MKITEAIKVIDQGWVQKPKGFRVRFQIRVDSRWETDYSPGEKAAPMDSDVATWRLAWKLAVSTPRTDAPPKDGDMVNICAIDDAGARIPYYATNTVEVFNPYPTD